ncbi:hypothetical protein BC827DRAFT_1273267 [Russula dissimulans]|nr:hypothetical protein BC827DRAFT_1273267 [Russula dissimulans]
MFPPFQTHLATVIIITGPRQQEYGYLPYQHHLVTNERRSTTPFLFSSLAHDISSSSVRHLIQDFLRIVYRSRRQTWSAHDVKKPALRPPQSLPCFFAGVSLELCASLEAMPLVGSSRGTCTSNATKSNFLTTIHRPTLKHSLHPYNSLFNQSSSTFSPSPFTFWDFPRFGALLSGLGSAALPSHHTYLQYLRATYAMEHALIRKTSRDNLG